MVAIETSPNGENECLGSRLDKHIPRAAPEFFWKSHHVDLAYSTKSTLKQTTHPKMKEPNENEKKHGKG